MNEPIEKTGKQKAKQSITLTGRTFSPEHRAHLSVALMGNTNGVGHHPSPETCAKISAAQSTGGLKATNARKRGLDFVPLNKPFTDCEAHHVDPEQVIFLPKELHRSIYHRIKTGKNMAQMNAVAYNFLFKQEVEALIPKRET